MKNVIGILVLAGSGLVCGAATNVWCRATAGDLNALTNWAAYADQENPTRDWDGSSFGSLFITNLTGGAFTIRTNLVFDALTFASPDAAADAVWTLSRISTANYNLRPTYNAEIRVANGILTNAVPVNVFVGNAHIAKTGAGTLDCAMALGADWTTTVYDVKEGRFVFDFAYWNQSVGRDGVVINFAGPDALGYRLGNSENFIGEVVDPFVSGQPADLGGRELTVGGFNTSSLRTAPVNGRLVLSGASTFHLGEMPTNLAVTVGAGDLVVSAIPDLLKGTNCVGYWRFEIPDLPGFDDGPWANELSASGSPRVVQDAERGNVLQLDGSSWFNGRYRLTSDKGGGLLGMTQGAEPYTVALWMKVTAASVPNVGLALFKFGNLVQNECSTFKVANAVQLFHQHGGDRATSFMANGIVSGWHHLAVVHEGEGLMTYYMDGTRIATADWTVSTRDAPPALKPQEFLLGGAWSKSACNFEGLMDDVVFLRGALTAEEIGALQTQTLAPAVYPSDFTARFAGTGAVRLQGAQTLTAPTTDTDAVPRSGYALDGTNATLNVTGASGIAGRQTTAWGGALTGQGGLVKEDANLDWVMTGESSYAGPTEVQAGALRLRGPGSDLVGHWTFDATNHPLLSVAGVPCALTPNDASKVAVVTDPDRGRVLRFTLGGLVKGSYPAHFAVSNGPFSVAMWVKPDATCPNGSTYCVWGEDGVGHRQIQFRLWGSYTKLVFSDFQDSRSVTGFNDFRGGWHHLAITRAAAGNGTLACYLDGTALKFDNTTQPALNLPLAGTFELGSCWERVPNERSYVGLMDDVRVYQRTLTAAEVKALADGTDEPAVGPACDIADVSLPKPVVHYAFDDPANPGRDSSGNGYDLTAKAQGVTLVDSAVRGTMARFAGTGGLVYQNGESTFPAKMPYGASNLTVTAWVLLDEGVTADMLPIVFWGDGTPAYALILDTTLSATGLRFVTLDEAGGTVLARVQSRAFAHGSERLRLHHVACVQNNTTKKFLFYVDGICLQTTDFSWMKPTASHAANFSIGCRPNRTDCLKGCLDEVKVYAQVLTPEQIREAMRRERAADAYCHVLPTNAVPSVAAGASLALEGVDQTLGGVTGAGALKLDAGTLTLTTNSTFAGTVTGAGTLALAEGATFTANGTATGFTGTVRLGGGVLAGTATWPNAQAELPAETTLGLAAAPYATVGGTLMVGATGTLAWTGAKLAAGDYPLATAGTVTLASGAATVWTVSPATKQKTVLTVRANGDGTQTLLLRVLANGTLLLMR